MLTPSSGGCDAHPLLAPQEIYDSVDDCLDGRGEEEEGEEKEEPKHRPAVACRYQLGEDYFVTDMMLPRANEHMTEIAQNLLNDVEQGSAASSGSPSLSPSRAPLLSALLSGGAFAYVGVDGEVELPIGVASWTVTHHLWNQTSQRRLPEANVPFFPLHFHCESHRAGAVNWRTDDVPVVIESASRVRSTSAASAAGPLPAYWLCVEPETENLALFQDVMTSAKSRTSPRLGGRKSKEGVLPACYSIDDMHAPVLRSVEPLLRAGVCIRLVTQHERELVILAPGTPHCVFTPPAATKVSRNWTTPQALLAAAVRALRGASGQRGEWIQDLRDHPLQCLLPALRRLYVTDPEEFRRLATHPTSRAHLCFILSRARDIAHATDDEDLQTLTTQVSGRMDHFHRAAAAVAAGAAICASSSQSLPVPHIPVECAVAMDTDDDDEERKSDAGPVPPAAVSSLSALPLHLSSEARYAVLATYTARCRAYREVLVERLQEECPLTSALRVLDGLLLAAVPVATVEELCTELVAQQSTSTVQDALHAIDTAHKQRHAREAKRQRQVAAEQEVHAALQVKLQQAGAALPDMWQKLVDFKGCLETVVPLQQRPSRLSLLELRTTIASWSAQHLRLYRRLFLHDLAAFWTPATALSLPREALLIYAAPEAAHNLLRWRAILCG